jgi:hypothetical protein
MIMHVKKLQICNCKLHSYFLQQQLLTQNSHAGQTGGNETCYTVLTEKESEVHESEVIFFFRLPVFKFSFNFTVASGTNYIIGIRYNRFNTGYNFAWNAC